MPYDYLILCTGQQFQVPVPTGADISTLVTTSEVTMPKVSRYTGPLPSSVFTITTERDCDNALNYIRGDFLAGQGKFEKLQIKDSAYFFTTHTFCASRDTWISYGWCLLIQGYFCAV